MAGLTRASRATPQVSEKTVFADPEPSRDMGSGVPGFACPQRSGYRPGCFVDSGLASFEA
jgi:hypothetical protein